MVPYRIRFPGKGDYLGTQNHIENGPAKTSPEGQAQNLRPSGPGYCDGQGHESGDEGFRADPISGDQTARPGPPAGAWAQHPDHCGREESGRQKVILAVILGLFPKSEIPQPVKVEGFKVAPAVGFEPTT